MTEPIFRGVAVALVTLFDERLEVDVAATTEHAVRLAELGIAAIVVAGTTGEAAALTADERSALLTSVRDAVPIGVPVIAGTGAPDARTASDLTTRASHAGADAALALSPPLTEDPRPYYATVAEAAPDLPLLAYHYPAVSSPGIPLRHLAELPVVGMKDSTGDPDRLLAELDEWDRPVYTGSSALISAAAALHCPGVIVALANAEPEGCLAAWNGGRGDGSAQRALAASHLAQRGHGGFPHGIKALTSAKFGTATHARMG